MRNQCPFSEEQLRQFKKYTRDPMSFKAKTREKLASRFAEYKRWKAYDARRPERGVILPRKDYDDTRFPGEARKSNKKQPKFIRPQTDREQSGREYWYFYPGDAKLLRTEEGSGKAAVRAAIVVHSLAWNINRKIHDRLEDHDWEQGQIWYPRHVLARVLAMSEAEVRRSTARACEAGLLRQSKESRYGRDHRLFYRLVNTVDYLREMKNGKQFRVRVDLAKEHGFAAACLWENQFIWTRRALETISPDDDGLLFCGQKMTDLEEVVYKKIFSRSELEKGLRRLVKAGLLVKRVDGVALEGSRNVRFYSLSAKEIARLRAEVRADRTDWERKTDALIPPEIEAEQEQEDRAEIPGIVPLEAVLVTPETPVRQPVEPKLEQVRANLPQPALVPGQITLDAMDELDESKWVMSNPPVKKSQNTPSEKSAPKEQMPPPKEQINTSRIGYPGRGEDLASLGPRPPASNHTQRAKPADVGPLSGLPPEGPGQGAAQEKQSRTPGGSRPNRKQNHELSRPRPRGRPRGYPGTRTSVLSPADWSHSTASSP